MLPRYIAVQGLFRSAVWTQRVPLVLLCCRLNAGILAVGLVVYALVARTYTEKPVTNVDKVRCTAAAAAARHQLACLDATLPDVH
jgi:hypothetical protein